MTVFWLHGEELMFGSSVHHVQPRIPQMKMMKVHIPFTFKLQETSKSSYKGRILLLQINSLYADFTKMKTPSLFCKNTGTHKLLVLLFTNQLNFTILFIQYLDVTSFVFLYSRNVLEVITVKKKLYKKTFPKRIYFTIKSIS